LLPVRGYWLKINEPVPEMVILLPDWITSSSFLSQENSIEKNISIDSFFI
tara:strand:- start:874 stop:1023 length:150 start_codon:yes stop_codon:yes gene_type:complete